MSATFNHEFFFTFFVKAFFEYWGFFFSVDFHVKFKGGFIIELR